MKIDIDKFESWLKAKNLKERTVEEYMYYLNKFLIYPGFNQENVSRFLAIKSNRNGVARSFLLNLQKFLRVNYREIRMPTERLIEVSEVELPSLTGRREQKIIKPIPEEDIWTLEKFLSDEKDKLRLLISYYCGLRIGEMLKIKIIDFNWSEWKKDSSKVGRCKVFGKGSKEGDAYLPSWLMKRIAKYIRSKNFASLNSFIFIRSKHVKNINPKTTSREWQKRIKEAGINSGLIKLDENKKIIKETDIWPHKLRHSWGYYLREKLGMDIREIKEILRHSTIQSTQRYLYVDKEKLGNKIFEKTNEKPKILQEE